MTDLKVFFLSFEKRIGWGMLVSLIAK